MKYDSITQIVKELKSDYPMLSDYELLSLAIQQQRNEILIAAFNVSKSDNYASALVAVAIQLGYKNESFGRNLIDVISELKSE